MAWQITYGFDDIQPAIEKMDADVKAKFVHISDQMITKGSNFGMPYTEALGEGLYQIRAVGHQTTGRVLYCTLPGEQIVLLRAFVKKTEATSPKELKIARERMAEVKAAHRQREVAAKKKGKKGNA
ncbi:MAG: type II toxin-antitoxin system RelE/ParE family toxin [Candidatus Sericytochromatia bacterium]|nr:type II toxin-antitoxin system RelE/ParE family toxin [Candidatus Tanganyikabacteria bacterium]